MILGNDYLGRILRIPQILGFGLESLLGTVFYALSGRFPIYYVDIISTDHYFLN